jgi:hypothetical protein
MEIQQRLWDETWLLEELEGAMWMVVSEVLVITGRPDSRPQPADPHPSYCA